MGNASAVLVVLVLLMGGASEAASGQEAIVMTSPGGVPQPAVSGTRSDDPTLVALMQDGARRSATLHGLIDAIARAHGIVYVEYGHCAFGHLDGCLLPYVAVSGAHRYLRVVVTPVKYRNDPTMLLALIAHELRHALEVLEHPEVIDRQTLEAMYRRLGVPLAGLSGYETSAARAAGTAVLSELSDRRE